MFKRCLSAVSLESGKMESVSTSLNLLIVQRHCESGRNSAEAAAISAEKAATDFPIRVSCLDLRVEFLFSVRIVRFINSSLTAPIQSC